MDRNEGAATPATDHQPLHAVDRRLDRAFDTLTTTAPDAFLHCLQGEAGSSEVPPVLAERLPSARWIPTDTHALTYVDPSDHLIVHQAWLEACHGPDRVARATVRTIQPLAGASGEPGGPVGLYELVLIDLVGTDGVDAVVVTLTPAHVDDHQLTVVAPPPRGASSFRLRLDTEGTITGGTVSVTGMLGHDLEDLVGLPIAPMIHPDDLEPASGTWDDVLANPDQSQTVRVRLQHADGSWRWFHDTAWNALDDPDTPGILSEFHDIHALVEAEQALHASELGFRTLAESLPVGVSVLDPDGRIHFANHRLVTILDDAGLIETSPPPPLPDPDGPGFLTNWADLVVPAFASQVAELLRPSASGVDAPASRQVEVTGADGQSIHLLVQAVTIWNQDGRSIIVSVQDVSEEVHISRAHARLIQVVDEVDDVVILCRIDDTIAYLNQAARKFLGKDAVGRPIKSFMPPRVPRDITEEAIEPQLLKAVGWRGDLEIVDLEGASHTMATTVSPVVDPSREELHVGITMRDVTAERAHERVLARLARHDTLTGLPNRFALMELLEAQRRHGDPAEDLAVFFVDLDNLKIVNDGLGHSAGDRLLVAVADELARAAGNSTVARFGGDEFVVVCEGVGQADALDRARSFLMAVERAEVIGVSNHVSASIGVATSTRGLADPEGLIRDADAAMYAAKRAGRARCALFDETLRNRVTRRFQLEAALRHTLEQDGLDIAFQPIVSLTDGAVTGLEALCRWNKVSPGEFIPIAEESGLILPLGAQVMAKSLAGAAVIRAADPRFHDLRIGINVSARELDQPDYAARTLAIIEASGVPIEAVVLELTESVLIDPRDEVDTVLRTLRDTGITLALDDFGSGYSSLTYLRRYPLDILKLDISYTQAMEHDPETRVIVEALVAMANRLGLRVVAEGVETEEHLRLVRELDVTWAQGYLVGRPAPAADLLADGLHPIPGFTSPAAAPTPPPPEPVPPARSGLRRPIRRR